MRRTVALVGMMLATSAHGQVKQPRAPTLSAQDIKFAALALQLEIKGGRIVDSCGEPVSGSEGDLNHDGVPEMVFTTGLCASGNAGWFGIATKSSNGGWRPILEFPGTLEILNTSHGGWVDLSLDFPSNHETNIYVWTGSRYEPAAGRDGKAVAASAARRPSGKMFDMGIQDTGDAWDYKEGRDLTPEEMRRGNSNTGYIPDDGGAFGGIPAPAGTVWNYGNPRWVIQPGRGCPQSQQLWKGYCFGALIGYLKSHPNENNIVAITLSDRVPLGTFISNTTPVRYNYIELKRDGDSFSAWENRRGSAHVKTPLGCHYSPLKEGFVLTGPGPRGLTEAALFRCP